MPKHLVSIPASCLKIESHKDLLAYLLELPNRSSVKLREGTAAARCTTANSTIANSSQISLVSRCYLKTEFLFRVLNYVKNLKKQVDSKTL